MAENESCCRNNVLLFRASVEGKKDPYDEALKKHGFKPYSIPVLDFNFINVDRLGSSLQDSRNHSAIVFTSQRAVEACVLALQEVDEHGNEMAEKRRRTCTDLPCYVVGGSTSRSACNAGFCPVGEDTGNAEKLAEKITNELKTSEKPLLYPCGNLHRDTLSNQLKRQGFIFNEIEVYETVRNKNINTKVKEYLEKEGMPEFVVYFSPSGIQYTEDIVNSDLLLLKNVKIVAIGPTTEKELIKQGLPVFGVARQPDPGGVVEVLLKDGE